MIERERKRERESEGVREDRQKERESDRDSDIQESELIFIAWVFPLLCLYRIGCGINYIISRALIHVVDECSLFGFITTMY